MIGNGILGSHIVRVKLLTAVTLSVVCCVPSVTLRSEGLSAGDEPPASLRDGENDRIEADADVLEYNRETGWIEGKGHVVIRKGSQELRARYVRVNVKTETAHAFGNVLLRKGDEVWRGRSLRYNFKTKTGNARELTCDAQPFRVLQSSRAERSEGDTFVLQDALVTTCTNAHPHCHFCVKAKEIEIVPDEYMKARRAAWYLGRVPVMYLPYWYRNLQEDFGFRFYPGHSSRMGSFLLSSCRYRLNPVLKGTTHLDYRSKRGLGIGQDLEWDHAEKMIFGELSGYYMDDKKPIDDDEDADTADIENDRYRLRLQDEHSITDRDYLLLQAHYLSDTDILEDFFEDEYREGSQPENYAAFAHRADAFTASLLVQGRLNDFYSNVNRVPEASLDVMRQQIGNSFFYYEGQTAAAYLERVWEEDRMDAEDYALFRFDSLNTVYRPARWFGFLNLIPRVGYRGTYYSETRDVVETVQTVTTTETNVTVDAGGRTNIAATTTVGTNTVSETVDKGPDFRSQVEMGIEVSFKAFKTWDNLASPKRHIVEPYANYTVIPEPTVLPDALYRFDYVDELDEQHFVKFGTRNKLQTKRKDHPFDLVDVDVYSIYNLDLEEGEEAIENIYLDAEIRPVDCLYLDMDAVYDVQESDLAIYNTRITVSVTNALESVTEYRFKNDSSSLLSWNVTLFPGRSWQFNVYGRYEFEESRLEEQGCYIQRNLDCMAIRTGASSIPGYTRSDGTEREDEVRFLLELWLTAFPEASLRGKHIN